MADNESNYEPSLQPRSAATEYYKDLYYSRGESNAIVIALTKLLDKLPAPLNLKIEDVYDVAFTEYELSVEPRIAGEKLALLPFTHIGPLLDESDCPLEVVKQWYADATQGTLQLTNQTHSEICFESGRDTMKHMACEHSSICPRIFLERFLTDDAFFPDFDDERYQRNLARTMQLVRCKTEVAKDCRVALPLFCDAKLKAYDEHYNEYVAELMRQIGSDVDNLTF